MLTYTLFPVAMSICRFIGNSLTQKWIGQMSPNSIWLDYNDLRSIPTGDRFVAYRLTIFNSIMLAGSV